MEDVTLTSASLIPLMMERKEIPGISLYLCLNRLFFAISTSHRFELEWNQPSNKRGLWGPTYGVSYMIAVLAIFENCMKLVLFWKMKDISSGVGKRNKGGTSLKRLTKYRMTNDKRVQIF